MHSELEPGSIRITPPEFASGNEGLRRLAWALRHPKCWNMTHHWKFDTIFRRGRYGTVGCALGVAQIIWPHVMEGSPCTGRLAQALALPLQEIRPIFVPQPSAMRSIYRRNLSHTITPSDVADAIDRYLATGSPEMRDA